MSRSYLVVIGALLAGCATRVPQSLSSKIVPETFTAATPGAPQIWPDPSWWQGFGDTELTNLVTTAQGDNRDIAVAAARVLEAQAQSAVKRSALFPQIAAQASFQNGGCRGDGCINFTPGKTYGLGFNASYELDVWGLARANLRSAKEAHKAARFAQQSVALVVTADVVDEYLSVLALRSRIAIANEDIAAIDSITDIIKLRVQQGATSHLDMAREQAQVEDVKAQLASLQTQEQGALFSLAVLLGKPPEGFDVKAQNLANILAPPVGAGLPSELLRRRPDIAEAEANLASAHANVDAARAAFLPQISLTGQGGLVSSMLSTLLRASNFGYQYGANLLQTIFDGGQLLGQKHLAEATQSELVASYQGRILSAYADVETALVEVANSGKAEQHLRLELTAAREAFEISQLQYRQGVGDLLTVLQAQQTLFSAEDLLAQTTLANRQAAVHLYEALGGGWLEDPADQTQFVPLPPK
jgi:outer membrane protein, multidrug efflux system